MISAYFDESGHAGDTDFVTMGGFVAEEEKWSVLGSKWNGCLSKYGLSQWHSVDYAQSTHEYKRWKGDESKRRELYGAFMEPIIESRGVPLGATVSMAHWRQTSDVVRRSLMDPYYLTLQLCLLRSSDFRSGMFGEQKMRLVFDDNREFKGRIPAIYKLFRESTPEGNQLSEEPAFASATSTAQMQVADLVAYEVRRFHHNHLNRPWERPRWGYEELVKMVLRCCKFGPLPWFWHIGEEALGKLEQSAEQLAVDAATSGRLANS